VFDPVRKKVSAKAGCEATPAKSRTPSVKKYFFMIVLREKSIPARRSLLGISTPNL
jgi:hypothetical protein